MPISNSNCKKFFLKIWNNKVQKKKKYLTNFKKFGITLKLWKKYLTKILICGISKSRIDLLVVFSSNLLSSSI